MTKRTRPNVTPEFRLECAQLVVDKDHSVIETAKVMNVPKSMTVIALASKGRYDDIVTL